MKKKSNLITKAELARRLGVSETTIHKGCKNGRFPTYQNQGKEMVNFVECRTIYINTATRGGSKPKGNKDGTAISDKVNGDLTSGRQKNKQRRVKKSGGSLPPEDGGTVAEQLDDVENMFDIHNIRLVTERNKALKEQLNFQILQKKYVPFAEVKKEFVNIAETLKKSILAIPDRLAPLIAGETDAHTVRQMLIKELKQSLTGIVKSNMIQTLEAEHEN